MSDERGTHTNGARSLVTRVFGLLAAAAAAEHGLGEALQGSRAAAGPFIQSWPDAALFRIEGGPPALPNPGTRVALGRFWPRLSRGSWPRP